MKKNLSRFCAAVAVCALVCCTQCGNNPKQDKEADDAVKTEEPAPEAITETPAAPAETAPADQARAEYDIAIIKGNAEFTAPVFSYKDKTGDENLFLDYVFGEIKYPEDAVEDNTQGTVTIGFTVDTEGNVGNVNVLKGADPRLDAEAVRAISASPKWTPAKNAAGEAIVTRYTVPVVFKLK